MVDRRPRPEHMGTQVCRVHGPGCIKTGEAYCLTCETCFEACDLACLGPQGEETDGRDTDSERDHGNSPDNR